MTMLTELEPEEGEKYILFTATLNNESVKHIDTPGANITATLVQIEGELEYQPREPHWFVPVTVIARTNHENPDLPKVNELTKLDGDINNYLRIIRTDPIKGFYLGGGDPDFEVKLRKRGIGMVFSVEKGRLRFTKNNIIHQPVEWTKRLGVPKGCTSYNLGKWEDEGFDTLPIGYQTAYSAETPHSRPKFAKPEI